MGRKSRRVLKRLAFFMILVILALFSFFVGKSSIIRSLDETNVVNSCGEQRAKRMSRMGK